MKFKDYYKIIGVSPEASAEQIKTAYRKLARKYHPDVSKEPNAEKRFTDIGEANEVLKDPARRAAYNKLRAAGWSDGQEIDAPPPAQEYRSTSGADLGADTDFSDFFQSLFGRSHSSRRQPQGHDVHAAFIISLEEAYHGGERQFSLQSPTINDHGEMVDKVRTITVKIPTGVQNGTKMRLRGQGQPGATSELNGDLYLELELAPHAFYRIEGRDLTLDIPITPWEAVLGAQVAVPTLGGIVTATIPANAQSGQKLRLKGRGLPGTPPGDQYMILILSMPPTTSDKAKSLYQELAKESSFNPRVKLGV